jgi:hypothetical protein
MSWNCSSSNLAPTELLNRIAILEMMRENRQIGYSFDQWPPPSITILMTTGFSYPLGVTKKNGPHCHFYHGYQQKIAQPLELDGRGLHLCNVT